MTEYHRLWHLQSRGYGYCLLGFTSQFLYRQEWRHIHAQTCARSRYSPRELTWLCVRYTALSGRLPTPDITPSSLHVVYSPWPVARAKHELTILIACFQYSDTANHKLREAPRPLKSVLPTNQTAQPYSTNRSRLIFATLIVEMALRIDCKSVWHVIAFATTQCASIVVAAHTCTYGTRQPPFLSQTAAQRPKSTVLKCSKSVCGHAAPHTSHIAYPTT